MSVFKARLHFKECWNSSPHFYSDFKLKIQSYERLLDLLPFKKLTLEKHFLLYTSAFFSSVAMAMQRKKSFVLSKNRLFNYSIFKQ